MFGIYQKSDGFAIAFQNGWAVSVRFGIGSYSKTRFSGTRSDTSMNTSPDAELALILRDRTYGDVFTGVTTEAYAEICKYVAGVPSFEDPNTVHTTVSELAESRAGWRTSPERNPDAES